MLPSKTLTEKSRDRLWNDAGYTIRELVSVCRNIAKDLTLEDGDTCTAGALAEKMWQVPNFIKSWQRFSAIGGSRQALSMALAHNPGLDLDAISRGAPEGSDAIALKAAILGYDNRIAQFVNHENWYQPHILPEDAPSGSSSVQLSDGGSDAGSSASKEEGDDDASSPQDKADDGATSISPSRADKGEAAP